MFINELRKQAIDEVAQLSGVMDVGDDYLSQVVRQECERVIPELDNVKPQDAATTFIFLKNYYRNVQEIDNCDSPFTVKLSVNTMAQI